MKKYYFFFIFKYRFRRHAFNNFLKIKKIKNYRIFDLSGPIKYFLFSKILIFITKIFNKKFNKFIFISCDALPLIKNNGVNIWFAGTSLRVPNEYKKLKNNIPMIRNFIRYEENFISLFPRNLKKVDFKKQFKIIYIGGLKVNNSKISLKIWKKYKLKILNNLSLIDDKIFWKNLKIKNKDDIYKIYLDLKYLIRLNVIIILKKKFKKDLIIVGNDWKKYIKDSLPSNHNIDFIKSLYQGNICLDFGSSWGDNSLYPRSVEIIESGGFLLQSLQADSSKKFKSLKKITNFDSVKDLIKKISLYKEDYNNLNLNYKKIYSFFSSDMKNYRTLTQIRNISKK